MDWPNNEISVEIHFFSYLQCTAAPTRQSVQIVGGWSQKLREQERYQKPTNKGPTAHPCTHSSRQFWLTEFNSHSVVDMMSTSRLSFKAKKRAVEI